MNLLLIIGIILVAAAGGLLGFVLWKNRKTQDPEQSSTEKSSSEKSAKQSTSAKESSATNTEQLSAEYVLSAPPNNRGTATQNFFILCTATFWVLIFGACYWAYSSRPIHGLIVASAAILVYSLVLMLQEILQNLIRLNERLDSKGGKE